jgi:hypothetical protein
MHLIVIKPFLDGKGRLIAVGDTLPTDYDAATMAHYDRLGLTAEAKPPSAPRATRKQAAPAETKPAAPAETKTDPAETPAETAHQADQAEQGDQAE